MLGLLRVFSSSSSGREEGSKVLATRFSESVALDFEPPSGATVAVSATARLAWVASLGNLEPFFEYSWAVATAASLGRTCEETDAIFCVVIDGIILSPC